MKLSKAQLECELRSILREILPQDYLVASMGLCDSLRSVGLDSLRTVELISAIELKFGVSIEEDDLRDEYFSSLAGLTTMMSYKVRL